MSAIPTMTDGRVIDPNRVTIHMQRGSFVSRIVKTALKPLKALGRRVRRFTSASVVRLSELKDAVVRKHRSWYDTNLDYALVVECLRSALYLAIGVTKYVAIFTGIVSLGVAVQNGLFAGLGLAGSIEFILVSAWRLAVGILPVVFLKVFVVAFLVWLVMSLVATALVPSVD